MRASSLEAIFIFICPPSFEELEKRLRARFARLKTIFPCVTLHAPPLLTKDAITSTFRGTEIEEQIQKRLRNAKAELEQGKSPGLFDHMLVNDDLEACYDKLKVSILLMLERRLIFHHNHTLRNTKTSTFASFLGTFGAH